MSRTSGVRGVQGGQESPIVGQDVLVGPVHGSHDDRSRVAGVDDRLGRTCRSQHVFAAHAIGDQQPAYLRYAFTRSPDAEDLSMAAMSSWRRTASAKSGMVWVRLSMSAANAA